jgi:Fic family protein
MYVEAPPNYGELSSKVDESKHFMEMMRAGIESELGDSYVHWDKLRHLDPPGELTREEWWLGIKMARLTASRALPAGDVRGRPFSYGTPDEVQRLLHYVDQRCAGEIAMGELVASDEQARHHYLVNSLMEEAIRSSQLEGATTTRRVAKELLRTGREPADRSERMILNNFRALEFMREEMGELLTPAAVLELHRILTAGTLDDPTAAGRLQRPDEERIAVVDATDGSVIHTPPVAVELPARLQSLCDFANQGEDESEGFVHPVVRAILLHFLLAYDHPFEDGNGRTARALFYWAMRTNGYWLAEYLSISRILREAPAQYSRAFLFTETDEGDTTYFLLHQLKTIRRAIEELHVYLNRKASEIRDVERLIDGSDGLNHRQLALLGEAIRHPESVFAYQTHATEHRVTHETARTDLLQLQERGLLTRRREGHRFVFSPVRDLSESLRRGATTNSK